MVKLLKKFTATILAFAILMSSSTVVFANTVTSQEKLDKLVELEAIKGDSYGVNADDTMTRYRSIVMMLRLKGLEDEMLSYDYAGKSTFTDAKSHTGYMQRLLAYIKNNPELGVDGYPDGSFKPLEPITAQEHAKMMLEVLGYEQDVDFAWNEVADKALEIGLVPNLEAIKDNLKFIILNLAVMTYDALCLNGKDKDITLGEETGFVIKVTLPKELEVTSVKSLNAGQVQILFNKALTEQQKEEAEDLDNYILNDEDNDEIDGAFASADVSENLKEVVLTVDYAVIADESYTNQSTYELVMDKLITGKEVVKTYDVLDLTIPEVTAMEVVGIRTIKAYLSEPVVAASGSDLEDVFELDEYSIDEVVSLKNNTELNIVLAADLKDGEELAVEVKSNAVDYAGYSLRKATFDVTVEVDDREIEIVDFKKASDDKVTLVLNKDVVFTDHDSLDTDEGSVDEDVLKAFYHSTASNYVERAVIDGNEITLYFGEEELMPETAYVFVEADVLTDLWDNENNDLNIKVTVTKDTVKPEVKEIEQDGARNIIITFSEDMNNASILDKDNYTIKDEDGNTVRISSTSSDDADEVTLTVNKDLEDGEEYSVAVTDVKDKAGNKIANVTLKLVATKDVSLTNDDVTVTAYDLGLRTQKIVVDFGTKMLIDGTRYAINNLENYDLKVTGGTTLNLSEYDGASIKVIDDGSKVEIRLPGHDADNEESFDFTDYDLTSSEVQLVISRIKTISGKTSTLASAEDVLVATNLSFGDIIATDKKTVSVEINGLVTLNKNDILFGYVDSQDGDTIKAISGNIVASSKIVKGTSKTVITYTLKEAYELRADGFIDVDGIGAGTAFEQLVVYTVNAPTTKDAYNVTLAPVALAAGMPVVDEIAPALEIIADNNGDDVDNVEVTAFDAAAGTATITLTFQENIVDAVTKAMFKLDDKDLTIDTVAVAGGNTIVINITFEANLLADEDDLVGVGITTESNIYDGLGNAMKIDTQVGDLH